MLTLLPTYIDLFVPSAVVIGLFTIGLTLAQAIAATGMGLMSLALVGELAPADRRATIVGMANSWRFAAAILGTLSAGILYQLF